MPFKILIAEKNKAVAQDLANRLNGFGYEVVDIVTSGGQAMKSIQKFSPDLIILNIRIQQATDGFETGELVQLKHDIPVIYMTEFAGQPTFHRSKTTGPFGYIFIPFSDKQVFTTLETALLRHQYEREIQRQAERAQTLVKSSEQLNADLDLKRILDTICHLAHKAIKASGTGLFLLDKKKSAYFNVSTIREIKQTHHSISHKLEIPANVVDSIVSTQNPVVVIDDIQSIQDIPVKIIYNDENIQSVVLAGIFYQRELVGFLVSVFAQTPSPLENEDLDLLKGLADQAAISITNANLFKQVQISRENERRLAKSIVDVQEEERRHIARELHDHLGQILTGLQFMLESVKKQDGTTQKKSIEEIQNTVSDMIEQVREMSLNLRPSMLDDMGLLPTLQWHIQRFEAQTGINVNFKTGKLEERFSSDIETAAYRIIQEALTNVARHAKVKEVFIGVVVQDKTLWIEVLDQGAGFDPAIEGVKPTSGLGGMRERAIMAGGYMVIESFVGQGTQIVVALPLTGTPLERRKFNRDNRSLGR